MITRLLCWVLGPWRIMVVDEWAIDNEGRTWVAEMHPECKRCGRRLIDSIFLGGPTVHA